MTGPSKYNDLTSRFDWMQATVRDDPDALYGHLALALGAQLEHGRGLNGYQESMVVKREDETLARVLFGGQNPHPHMIATGAASDDVVPVLRSIWPHRHEVTRMDSAADFDEPNGYRLVAYVLGKYSRVRNITLTEISSTKNGITSATTYLGAPSSRVRLRLYQKGNFELQEGREASPDWYRCELQVRPTGDARSVAAGLSPDATWGFSNWSRSIAAEVMSLNVEPVIMQPRREPDYMRAIRAMRTQYGAILARALAVEGSPEAVFRLLEVIE